MGKVGDCREQSCMVLKGKAPLFQHEEEAGRVINDKKTDKKQNAEKRAAHFTFLVQSSVPVPRLNCL